MSERSETAALLGELHAFISKYVVFANDCFCDAVSLWVLHTHAAQAFETSPRLLVKSPEKESGKTRLLEVLELLVSNPLFVVNTTISAIYRLLATKLLTLLHDEVDAVFSAKAAPQNEELRAIINSGYRRGAVVARAERDGKHAVKEFKVFAPTALAAIGNLPDTIESRSIIIPMRRRAPDEEVSPFRRRKVESEAHLIRDALIAWAAVYVPRLAEAEPDMPVQLADRAADIWEPLIAIADLAGGEWPQRARDAAVEVVAGRLDQDLSVGVRLLVDIRTVVANLERIASADLAGKLNGLDESGWGGWHEGKGMNQRDLAGRLRAYGIDSKNLKMSDGSVLKGYDRADFDDAFARYLRDSSSATAATDRYHDSYSKRGIGSASSGSRERRERRAGPDVPSLFSQEALPPLPELKPVAEVAVSTHQNGEADDVSGALFDAAYLEAVGSQMDGEAAALAEELEA